MMSQSNSQDTTDFEAMAQKQRPSLAREFLHFLKHNKKWWLLPILLVLLLLSLIILLGGSAVAPFIYPLF